MKNRKLIYSIIIVICIVISFFIGEVTENIRIGHESRRIESLKGEATAFFYKTIRELYAGNHNPENGNVGGSTLMMFKTDEFREKFNPVCHLGWLEVKYGDSFYGWLYCPSGEVYEVEIQIFNGKWSLNYMKSVNAKWFWTDIREDK